MRGYEYRNQSLRIIHVTSVPQCDEAALAYVPLVESWGLGKVLAISRREAGERKFQAFHVAQAD